MKKIIIALVLVFAFIGCSKDEELASNSSQPTTFKLKKITSDKGNYLSFYYEGNNLSYAEEKESNGDVYKRVLVYEGGLITKVKNYLNNVNKSNEDNIYVYSNGKITSSSSYEDKILFSHQYTYNSLGQMIIDAQSNNGKYCCSSYYKYYSDGNIKSSYYNDTYNNADYTYDNKINPEYYILPEYFVKISDISKNNIISSKTETYEYEYNSNNLPTKRITKVSGVLYETEYFEYY